MNNNKACAEYFKANPAYQRCFREFEKKWESYGRVTGSITLKNTSEEERRAIGGILGKSFYEDPIRFSFSEFEKGLQHTKFAPVNFEKILEAYFGRTMMTTQKRRMEEEREKADFFEMVEGELAEDTGSESVAVSWMREMYSKKKYGYQTVIREYRRDREQTEKLLKAVGSAISRLENMQEEQEEQPLAVFSAEISGNPHYFDQGTTAGQLLVHGMCYAAQTDYPENAHQWRELLLSGGIVPDNISSIVHIYGLRLQVDGVWHPAYDAFRRLQEPCAVTMENLQELTAVQPTGDKVYIVENEMVFSYLWKHLNRKDVTLLCTAGQLRSAAVKLIPFLLDSGAEIYYSGDIDPDGIRIADRLWRKYGDRIHVWRMSGDDYEKSLSEETIGNISMKKLEAVENPVLCETAKEIRKKKKAGYQENILKDLLADMNEMKNTTS
ncbi:MAG: TIGR02679 family protein [Lachnospiraceae bacterium]|nr:TIGR02679 family protein [Lachnospiraceae bacterium]